MEKIYFCVDKYGFELSTNLHPYRLEDYTKRFYDKLPQYMNISSSPTWVTGLKYDDFNGYYDPEFDGCYLPKGTIEKLTGKKITENDEPVFIEFEDYGN